MKTSILAFVLATSWIGVSEFFRNSFLLHSYWIEHFNNLGIPFPEHPVNGAMWGVWSICFAFVISVLIQKFSLIQTTLFSWMIGFVLMWLVIGNLGILPIKMLFVAIPLSLLETFIASYIFIKLRK